MIDKALRIILKVNSKKIVLYEIVLNLEGCFISSIILNIIELYIQLFL